MKESILYIGGMEFPDKNAAAQRVITNCKILDELGYNIILAGMNKEKNIYNHFYSSDRTTLNNKKVYSRSYPLNFRNWIDYMINIDNIIEFIKNIQEEKIVAIIAYNYPSIALLKLKRYCEKKNITIIADCTEWYGNKNILKSFDTSFRMRYVQKKIKNVICISDYLEKYYKSKGCVTVNIPSLIDKKDLKWKKIEKEKKRRDVKIFSYVGSPGVTKEKDRLDFIISAFSQLKKINSKFIFKIVGMTEEEFLGYFPNYKQVLLELGNNIVFFGRLSHVESLEKIKESDFSIFARMENIVTQAGFPTKLAESFACGTPVVTNPTSNISTYIYQGKNGFLAKDSSLESLKQVILCALNTESNKLDEMKVFSMNENPLDYRKFQEEMKDFTNRVLKKSI